MDARCLDKLFHAESEKQFRGIEIFSSTEPSSTIDPSSNTDLSKAHSSAVSESYSAVSRTYKVPLIIIVLCVHCILIASVLFYKPQHATHPSPTMRYIKLEPERPNQIFPMQIPVIKQDAVDISSRVFPPPQLHIEETVVDYRLTLSAPDNYQLTDKKAEAYKDIFDPRLRKQLEENYRPTRKPAVKSYESFTNVHGATVVAVGDGHCMVSMPKVDSRDRATNWGSSSDTCGRTDSQKMMDEIEKDLEARKHPLDAEAE